MSVALLRHLYRRDRTRSSNRLATRRKSSRHLFVEELENRRMLTVPTADAGGPYFVQTDGTTMLDGSASNDPDDDIVSYEWDLDNDGVYGESGVGAGRGDERKPSPTFIASGYLYPNRRPVALKITDRDGATSTDQASVEIVPIAAALTHCAVDRTVITTGESVELTGEFVDLDPADNNWIRISWGDGVIGTIQQPSGDTTFSVTHTYDSFTIPAKG